MILVGTRNCPRGSRVKQTAVGNVDYMMGEGDHTTPGP